jgi:hypothetical protein
VKWTRVKDGARIAVVPEHKVATVSVADIRSDQEFERWSKCCGWLTSSRVIVEAGAGAGGQSHQA